MVKNNKPIFKYLYNPEEINNFILDYEQNLDINEISILKDFNDFLTIYHRIPQKEIEYLFNKKISNEIKFLCVKVIIDFSVDNASDEEIIECFGELIYRLIKDLCTEYEYPNYRTKKYANLYRNIYKYNISYFLKETANGNN
jgi:hypothetical protein